MDAELRSTVSGECHRLEAELRLTNQKSFIPEVLEDLRTVRFDIWSKSLSVGSIISPFQKVIEHPKLTDIITAAAVNSLEVFVSMGLFQTTTDISTLAQCLCSCQCQLTSESDCLALTAQILAIFRTLSDDRFSALLDANSIESLFKYCEQDIRHLTQSGVHARFLTRAVTSLTRVMLRRDDIVAVATGSIMTLFYIADSSYTDCGGIARGVALSVLVDAAQSPKAAGNNDFMRFACVLLYQQLALVDGRDNFVLALRLFFVVFKERWLELARPFGECIGTILDFCTRPNVSQPLKATAFAVLVDFVSQPGFLLDFYATFSNRPMLPNVFEKFLDVVISFGNVPAAVPDAQATAVSLLAMMIAQLTPESGDARRMYDEVVDGKCVEREQEQAEKMREFVEKFRQKPSSVITDDSSAADLARMIFTAEGISKQSIGDFFGQRKTICLEVLREYVALFDFAPLNIDQAIRLFLSFFRIPGEAQIVDRLLDYFSEAYFKAHPGENFASAAAVHIFSMGYLMLHTCMHNESVKVKETLTGFMTLLKGKNDGEDWDGQFMTLIFNSVKRTEISATDSLEVELLTTWELMQQKHRVRMLVIQHVTAEEQPCMVIKLFREIWQVAAPIFTVMFDHSDDAYSLVLRTFSDCAAITAYYDIHDLLDNLIVNLCRFSNATSKKFMVIPSSREALRTLSNVIFQYGGQIQEGWRWLVELLIDLFRLDALPENMRMQTSKEIGTVIGPKLRQRDPQRNSGVFSLFRMLSAYENESDSDCATTELKNVEQRNFVKECRLDEIFEQSLHFSAQSLSFFIKSLILAAQGYSEDLDEKASEAAICLHWITQTVVVNSERIHPLWNVVYEIYAGVLSGPKYSTSIVMFQQRVLMSTLTLINHMWGQKKVRGELVILFDKLAGLDRKTLVALLPDIVKGIQVFFSVHLATFTEFFKYEAVLSILTTAVDNPDSAALVHMLTAKFNSTDGRPGRERFADLWLPLVKATALFCVRESSPDVFARFRGLQGLLTFTSFSDQTSDMWNTIFESVIFATLAELPSMIRANPLIGEPALFMVKTSVKTFISACHLLNELAVFECVWFKLVQFSFNLMHIGDADLTETIPELLVNAMFVMKGSGIFDGRPRMWAESRAVMEPMSAFFAERFSS